MDVTMFDKGTSPSCMGRIKYKLVLYISQLFMQMHSSCIDNIMINLQKKIQKLIRKKNLFVVVVECHLVDVNCTGRYCGLREKHNAFLQPENTESMKEVDS